jgi:hypothetical protein
VTVVIRKNQHYGEHSEHGEGGKTDFHDPEHIKGSELAAFDTEVF